MSISVKCPGCDHSFEVSNEDAGSEVSCPECEEPVSIPDREEEAGSSEEQEGASPDNEELNQDRDRQDDSEPEKVEEEQFAGRFDLILKAIPIGLRPKKVGMAAGGLFLATLVFWVISILGTKFGSPMAALSFFLLGLVISLGVAFQVFAAVSRMSLAELKGDATPDWDEVLSYLSDHISGTLMIPFGLLLCTVLLLLMEFLLGWIGVIPYIGGVFLFVLAIGYLLLNIGVLILLVLSLWLTFPHLAHQTKSPVESAQSLYQDIRQGFGDYLVDLSMVLVVMMVFVWVIGSFCVGALYMTSGTLLMQTTQFVENTFQEEASADSSSGTSDLGDIGRQARSSGPMSNWFGQLIFAVIVSILTGLVQGPLLSVFYTGGCAAYLSEH